MDHQEAVKTAEEAVVSMKDPKLKEIAFGQILEKLLSSDGQKSGRNVQSPKRAASKTSKPCERKKKEGPIVWLRELVAGGFFKEPRSSKAILAELAEQSHHLQGTDLIWALRHLCHSKVLRRKRIAPLEGKAALWHWSTW